MPQINRIRVNNVKYNFGTQYYDDFLMRFSCRNSIYDLANGGGKSVLMLLLLQNLIPNCTLDDKQPIEKMFRTGMGNTTIHSLVEWKLDSCDIKNGFRYMTTGFCARKAKEAADEADKNSENASIEYFNYCIFYREFGENDIKNLPLSTDKERITYNGLKSYLRDLEKRDFGVEVRIFDRKGDYQNFISNYGLYESQWEIVRGINKTEGHVRTYFENSYKTTRKVIEDLLIEGIIEKSYNNRIRKGEEDDSQMAKTLLDIKDKLIDLAKRREEINNYDGQIDLLNSFADRLDGLKNIFADKKIAEEELLAYLLKCKGLLSGEKKKSQELDQKKASLEEELNEKNRRVALAEIEAEIIELEKIEALIEETSEARDVTQNNRNMLKEELKYKEAAEDYFEYLESKRQFEELKELLENSNLDNNEASRELAVLAASKKALVDKKLSEIEAELGILIELEEQKLASLEDINSKKMDAFAAVNREQGLILELTKETEDLSKSLDVLLGEVGLISGASAGAKLDEVTQDLVKCKDSISKYESLYNEEKEKLANLRQKITETDAKLTLTGEEIDRKNSDLEKNREFFDRLENIKKVYNEISIKSLIEKIEGLIHGLAADIVKEREKQAKLYEYEQNLKEGSLPEQEKHFCEIYDYLKLRYDDVKSGRDILVNMAEEDRKEILAKNPMMPYCIFADNSYDDIAKDKSIYKLNTGSYIVPILKKEKLEETDFFTKGLVSYKDMNFIFDEAAVRAELFKISEDLGKTEEILRRLEDKYAVMEEDLFQVKYILELSDPEAMEKELSQLKEAYEKLCEIKDSAVDAIDASRDRIARYETALEEENTRSRKLLEMAEQVKTVVSQNDLLNERFKRLKDSEKALSEANRNYNSYVRQSEILGKEYESAKKTKKAKEDKYVATNSEYEEFFAPYFKAEIVPDNSLTEEEIDAKAGALRQVIANERGDLKDKETLLKNYDSAMKKCLDNLKYKGISLEEAQKAREEGRLERAEFAEKIKIKEQLTELENKIEKTQETINSELTQKSRIEGSIWHGKKIYEEKYGEFAREEIADPNRFILAGRQEMSDISAKILLVAKEQKELSEANKDLLLMERDLERIVRNAGLTVPENVVLSEVDEAVELSTGNYEACLKNYEKLVKEEQKRKNVFLEEKQKLVDSLNSLKAYELAEEVKRSLVVPADIADIDSMTKGLKDTNDCIALERDSIEQSIVDMKRIKESFEERCVQICSNIRTELERLPKLSRITLDDEVISMITLSIPYIKEELYRDRMSVYINETVSCAEVIQNQDEKLKYIKNQLSWKKLFSVIVTDMNSIKLCLYKREHIKDQSRYLKYEEAVGSTGQSQGIYIQFLIAIIHYISNINAAGKDVAAAGKTIFIDNPFGAAKDVYIWEPIFKLLKTNHVQLIVPARGATPAISKMFDVNYILGQKMIGDRQQTVVVDYRSQANMEEMDYNILEYEQATLKLD